MDVSWIVYIFPAALVFGAAMDIATFTIPNRISIVLAAAFFISAPVVGLEWSEFGLHLAAGLLFLVIGIGLFAVRMLGGGDAKLLAAAALWVGLPLLPAYVFATTIVGGGVAVAILIYRAFPLPLPSGSVPWAERLHDPKMGIPFAVAICGGGLMVFPQTVWFAALGS
ncbi:MAG: prepilin peptidase [Pseudomonadota bacterium]